MKKTIITTDDGQPSGWFDKDKALEFTEGTRHNGRAVVSLATGKEFDHEALYLTGKSQKWILCRYSQWQGSETTYTAVDDADAFAWLMTNASSEELANLPAEIRKRYDAFLAAEEV